MRNKTKTEKAINYVKSATDDLILAANAGDGALFAGRIEHLLKAVADCQVMFTFESEVGSHGSSATHKLAAAQAEGAAVEKVVGGLSMEDRRRIRRLGLDLKYIGVGDSGQLLDLKNEGKL